MAEVQRMRSSQAKAVSSVLEWRKHLLLCGFSENLDMSTHALCGGFGFQFEDVVKCICSASEAANGPLSEILK